MKGRGRMFLLILSTSLLSACGGKSVDSASSPPEVEVYVVPAGVATSGSPYAVSSTLTVEHVADLLAEEPERLIEVLADEGRRVKRGQLLAQLDDSRLRKKYEEDRAEMQMLEVEARQAGVLRQAYEVELKRQEDLRKYGLGTERDYDRARFNLQGQTEEIQKARYALERSKAKVEDDQIRLSRLQLRAPFDGIVSRRYAHIGQMLLKDEKVVQVTELRPLLVRFIVPESLRNATQVGAEVEVVPVDLPSATTRGRIARTAFVVDPASGAVECVARLKDPVPTTLVPGMAVEVKVPGAVTPASAAGLWIPRTAVRRAAGGSPEVFAVQADRLQKRSVQLGRETAARVQVLKGLTGGEAIVGQATDQLQDGMVVRVRR